MAAARILRRPRNRWLALAEGAEGGAILLSPFLTGTVAEEILATIDPERCTVYTVFSLAYFADGSSAIASLRHLHEAGYPLFHLDDLHAKVVLFPGHAATVGSQNLTAAGKRNRELTAVLIEPSELRAVKDAIEEWKQRAVPITTEMLTHAEQLLEPAERAHRRFRRVVAEAKEELQRLLEAEEAERQREREARKQQVISGFLERADDQAIEGGAKQWGQVVERHNLDVSSFYFHRTLRRLDPYYEDLTEWGDLQLERLNRYLCVSVDSARVRWVRLGRSRITLVHRGLKPPEPLHLAGRAWAVRFEAVDDPEHESNFAVMLSHSIEPSGSGSVHLTGLFTAEGLEIQAADMLLEGPGRNDEELEEDCEVVTSIFEKPPARLVETLLTMALEPFKYDTALVGDDAESYFGPVGSVHWIRPVRIAGEILLLTGSEAGGGT